MSFMTENRSGGDYISLSLYLSAFEWKVHSKELKISSPKDPPSDVKVSTPGKTL